MPFKRTVEIGRVALCNYGPDSGKLFVIVDILDGQRVVVDRPDIVRCVCNLKRLAVTDLKVDVQRLAKKKELAAAFDGLDAKFGETTWGKKLARRKAKANMTDFDRYKAMVSKSNRAREVRKVFNKLKKSA